MNFGKQPRKLVGFTVLLASLITVLTQVDSVQATFSDVHAGAVLLRVEAEMLRKTPAGRYYSSLIYKHLEEANQIMSANPEHVAVTLNTIRKFIPELEALLDGKGDTVYLTAEHMGTLETELDWFASVGSPTLEEDIQKELQRLPPDDFVGMTMSEAWDFINFKWTLDMVTQPTPTPEVTVQTITTPFELDQTLVTGSGGKWAYYVHNGVYLEYPSSYFAFPSGYSDEFLNGEPFLPAMESIHFHPHEWQDIHHMPYSIEVAIWNDSLAEQERLLHVLHASGSVVWTRTIHMEEFDGIEYVTGESSSVGMQLGAILFNQEDELTINMFVTRFSPVPSDPDFGALIDQSYSYFQHMIDHLRMQTPESYK